MRTAIDNPFAPGSDLEPAVWAGRADQLHDWRDVVRPRRLKGLPERGRTILGDPGVGKSALVQRIRSHAKADGDWVTPQLRMPLGSDPLKKVAEALLSLADEAGLPHGRDERIGQVVARVQSVAVSGVSLSLRGADGPEPYTALTDLLVELGRAAIARNVMVMVHIDEVQNITDQATLSQLLVALGDALHHETHIAVPGGFEVERTLPIAVYLTGLPEFADMTGSRQGATFARRFAPTTLRPLSDDDLAEALRTFIVDGWEVVDEADGGLGRIHMEPQAASAIIDLCCGEPFLFQLAGQSAWNAGSGPIITREHVLRGWSRVASEAAEHVQRIIERLPERERQFLHAMAELEPKERHFSRIAGMVGYAKPSDAGPTGQRLERIRGIVKRGRPYEFRHRAVEAYLTTDWPEVD